MKHESVVSVGVERPNDETRLTKAIDAFTRWRADLPADATTESDAPAIIVRTSWNNDGALQKTLIFDDAKWADVFLKIWGREGLA